MSSRYFVLSVSGLMLIASVACAQVRVVSQDGMLSISANNVSASEVAEQLSNTLDISVILLNDDKQTKVNLDIVEEPLEKALAKLSPNSLLVRDPENDHITEVVLMLGEGTADNTGTSEQFLPSGSPANQIVTRQNQQGQSAQTTDPNVLRDPARALRVRQAAAAASSDANLPAVQVPPMFAEDRSAPLPTDPDPGLPLQQ